MNQCLPADVSVVLPTFNEATNIHECIRRLEVALSAWRWEVIVVDDDSPDGTADLVRALARADGRVRCVQRIGRRGLSRAVVEGVLASAAPLIAVMDADLQHDERVLPELLARLQADDLDVVIGSRYVDQGGVGDWDRTRVGMSRFATALSRLIITEPLTDPMSGFFAIRREAFDRAVRQLSGEGYKILLDIVASSPHPVRFGEVPYQFRSRLSGESKLDAAVAWQYLLLLLDKKLGRLVSARFVLFSLVGLTGLGVHFLVLALLYQYLAVSFVLAQAAATTVAMTTNFALNNVLTYRDSRLRGARWVVGLLSFYLVCGVGAVANVGVASLVFERHYTWLLAGLSGVVVGTVWNYVASSLVTWRRSAS